MGKARIRRELRATRRVRRGLVGVSPKLWPLPAAFSEEALGLLASWRRVLAALGPAIRPASAVSADPPSLFLPAPTASSAPRSGLTAALFWPTSFEPDVRGIVARAGRCLLPVLTDEGGAALADPMWGWCDLSDAEAVGPRASSQLHSPDPHLPSQPSAVRLPPSVLARADVVLTPALAVDASGTRLGQGGGWYDRALLHVREGVPVVAAVFDEEVLPAGTIPREAHDRSVNAVITPTRALLLD